MKKQKAELSGSSADLAIDPAGFAHALNLLLLAIRKTNPAVGSLLDEFTSMHARYLAELQALARESPEHVEVMQQFAHASKRIYRRLGDLDTEQSGALRARQTHPASSLRVH